MGTIELTTETDIRTAFSVMRELRDDLTEEEYLSLIAEMRPRGYRMFGLKEADELVAVAGVAILTNLYYGRHLWVYDLVTRSTLRSRGYGRELLTWLEGFARDERCSTVALSSGLQRTEAHRFYESHMDYEKASFVFKKRIA